MPRRSLSCSYRRRLMTFSRQILVGLALGILTGLFFGEQAAVLKFAADGFVKLLQMMVLPYITVSIITSLGSLRPAEVRTLGLRAVAVIGGLWLVALSFAFLIPLTFPVLDNASFFSSSLVERRPEFNFIDLYIPANPFNALANNVVPAVVLFSLILGIALIGVERRERLLDVLQVARDAISAATRFVTRLTPYGLFAIAATAAGTLSLEQLGRLQIYLVAYVAVALMISLWVLPGLVAALTPIRARDVLGESRDSLITASIAGDLFIVLPGLMHASRTLLDRLRPGDDEPARLTEVIVPGLLQLPAYGEAAVSELRALCGLVRRRTGAAVRLPSAGAGRRRHLLRQPHRGSAVSPRSVPDTSRHLSAVPRDGRDQREGRVARGGGAHADRRAAGVMRRHGPPALAARTVAVVRGGDRRARPDGSRRHPPAVRHRHVLGVLEGQSRWRPCSYCGIQSTPRSPASSRRRPRRTCRRSRPSRRARCCASATCPRRCRSRSSIERGDLVGFDVELAHRLAREMGVASPSCRWIVNGSPRNSRTGTAIS